MALLTIQNVTKHYGSKLNLTKALDGVSFHIDEGEFVAIMGASGSGKTTLLNCISTIDRVTSGRILLDGVDITKLQGKKLDEFRSKKLGFIFQDFNLLDTLTAYENIALALSIQDIDPQKIESAVEGVAKRLGIGDILRKYPYQLSGGQRQRVASARAIITNPKIVLADEPTGALDSHSSQLLMDRLAFLNRQLKTTILMVTHDSLTASYATRVIFLKDGKVLGQVTKGETERKEFLGKIMRVVMRLGGEERDAR